MRKRRATRRRLSSKRSWWASWLVRPESFRLVVTILQIIDWMLQDREH